MAEKELSALQSMALVGLLNSLEQMLAEKEESSDGAWYKGYDFGSQDAGSTSVVGPGPAPTVGGEIVAGPSPPGYVQPTPTRSPNDMLIKWLSPNGPVDIWIPMPTKEEFINTLRAHGFGTDKTAGQALSAHCSSLTGSNRPRYCSWQTNALQHNGLSASDFSVGGGGGIGSDLPSKAEFLEYLKPYGYPGNKTAREALDWFCGFSPRPSFCSLDRDALLRHYGLL
jgi:hypothetical protein